MLLAPIVSLIALATSAAATTYPIKASSGAKCRASPSLTAKVVKTYSYGAPVTIKCVAYGDSYAGYTLWDKTGDGCYVHDALIKTGSEKPVAAACGTAPPPVKTPALPNPPPGQCADGTSRPCHIP